MGKGGYIKGGQLLCMLKQGIILFSRKSDRIIVRCNGRCYYRSIVSSTTTTTNITTSMTSKIFGRFVNNQLTRWTFFLKHIKHLTLSTFKTHKLRGKTNTHIKNLKTPNNQHPYNLQRKLNYNTVAFHMVQGHCTNCVGCSIWKP